MFIICFIWTHACVEEHRILHFFFHDTTDNWGIVSILFPKQLILSVKPWDLNFRAEGKTSIVTTSLIYLQNLRYWALYRWMCWWCSTSTVLPTLGPRDPLDRGNPSPYKTTGRRNQNRDTLHLHQQFTLRPEVQPEKNCSLLWCWNLNRNIESVWATVPSIVQTLWTQHCIMSSCSILFTTF